MCPPASLGRTNQHGVIAGHSRSKNGVASLAYDPAIHDEVPRHQP
jgi:hypothetical protein